MDPADVERELRRLAERLRAVEDRLGIEPEPRPATAAVSVPANYQPNLQPIGIACVGLGAAYVLRALVESGALPTRIGVALGVVYAIFWLLAAGRRSEPLYALASALVVAPLLWEATLRFRVLSPGGAAAIVLAFTLLGMALSWRKNLAAVATIATLAGLAMAVALLGGTRDVIPFTAILLAVSVAVEAAACLEHWLAARWLAAAAADFAVLFATWLVTNPGGLPEGYAAIPHGWVAGAQIALLGMYLASTIVRTLFRHFTVTAFEAAQCAAAFAIAMWGGLPLAPGVLTAGAACYLVSFIVLDRGGGRNFYTYSTFGLLLVLASTRTLLAGSGAPTAWSALAIACAWSRRLTLEIHGAIYLALALTLADPLPAVAVAGICYIGAARGQLRIPMFAAAVWALATFAGAFAPPNLRLASKLVILGGALILLPRVKGMAGRHESGARSATASGT
jgi:hypothetical protein